MEPLDKNLEQVELKSVSAELIDPLFRDLVDRANDLFIVVSGDGRIRFVNASYCRLSGFEREKIEGERLAVIFDPKSRQNAQNRLAWALQAGSQGAVNLPVRTKSGENVEIAFRPAVDRTASGHIHRLVLVGQSPFLYGGLAEQFNTLHRDLRNYSQQLERLNAELEERIQERTTRLTALLKVTASLNAELQLDALFELLLRQAIETIPGAEAGALLLVDPDVDRLRVTAACGYANAAIVENLQHELERVNPQVVFTDRTVRVWAGVTQARTGQMRHLLYNVDQYRIRAAISAPIATPTDRLGVLLLHNFDDAKAFTNDDVALVTSLAGSAAVAITNAKLYQETRWQADRLELVNRLSASVRDSVDLQQTLDIAVEGLCLVLGASRAAITLFDDTAEPAFYSAQYGEPGLKSLDGLEAVLLDTPLLREVLAFKAPRVVVDTLTDPRVSEARRALTGLGVESLVVVPLVVRGRFIGTVELHQCDRVRRWRPSEVGLAESVARQVATGVHQARLHAKLRESVRETNALFELVSRAKREWESTFDAMSDAVFLFDARRRLARANSAASVLEQRSYNELTGRPCCEILADVEQHECMVERAMATAARLTFEWEREEKSFSITVDPLVADDGTATGAVAVVRDLSQMRQQEVHASAMANAYNLLLAALLARVRDEKAISTPPEPDQSE
jgi:PAS domain S-box-containing protein